MITTYHRPTTLPEALALLTRPDTLALGGGTLINTPAFKNRDFSVVDLQALGLGKIQTRNSLLEIGATVTLEQLRTCPDIPSALQQAIRQEASLNIRNSATVAGTIVGRDGRSPFLTALLALDAKLTLENGETASNLGLGEYLALRPHGLITLISLPLQVKFAYEQVARTPADLPIVCAALAQWNSGRTRLALGGTGTTPLLAMDGTEPGGVAAAARNAFHEANDEWASAAYRMDVAATLASRCLENLPG